MDSHLVSAENRKPTIYTCEHCGRPFICLQALYWHDDGHEALSV
jgi:hypothetical protein